MCRECLLETLSSIASGYADTWNVGMQYPDQNVHFDSRSQISYTHYRDCWNRIMNWRVQDITTWIWGPVFNHCRCIPKPPSLTLVLTWNNCELIPYHYIAHLWW